MASLVDPIVGRISESYAFVQHEPNLGFHFFGVPDVVCIKKSQKVALGHLDALVTRVGDARVLVFGEKMDSFIMVGQVLDDLLGPVGRGIVDDEEFPMGIALPLYGCNAVDNIVFHVVARHDDRYKRQVFHGYRLFNAEQLFALLAQVRLQFFF